MAGPYRIFWGETHDNILYQFEKVGVAPEDVYDRAASHLDFYATAYYTGFSAAFRPGGHLSEQEGKHAFNLEGWKAQERLDREWPAVQEIAKARNQPGRFVAFPGYEWQGDGSSGDHNVICLREDVPIFRVNTVKELYKCLRGLDAVAIPHHTAYRAGRRGRDWSVFNADLSPFAEVFSIHGCSETDEEWIGLRHNAHMGPGFAAGTYQAALDRGYHLGAICSTDNWGDMPGHYGRGTMACLAEELTRESLWEAFRARRVYGVTGDRIKLDFRLNDAPMGSIIQCNGKRVIRVSVTGCDALDRIEVLRNGRVIGTYCHQGMWDMPRPGSPCRFKIRIEPGWGPRPNELPTEDRIWRGEIRVARGKVLNYEPCWISPGQQRPRINGDRAAFTMCSSIQTLHERAQNANVFEMEADPRNELIVRMNGLEERGAVGDFAAGSREIWFKDECIRMLDERCGIAPGSPEREDIYHHMAFKVKIHRLMPEPAYKAEFEMADDTPLEGEANYRVRVEQRNAQRAWSSPIWVSPINHHGTTNTT